MLSVKLLEMGPLQNSLGATHPIESKASSFLLHVHYYRAIAIIFVLLAHIELLFVQVGRESLSLRMLATLIGGGTIVFIFISGYLFQHLSSNFHYGSYLLRKLQYVVFPYIVVAIPFFIHQYWFEYGLYEAEAKTTLSGNLLIAARALLTADHSFIPYWFIPAIVLIYIAAPLFLYLDKNPRMYWGLVLFIPVAALLHRSYLYANPLQNALHVAPVYLLGMMASHYRKPMLEFLRRFGSWLLVAVVCCTMIELSFGQGGSIASAPFSADAGVVDWNFIQKALVSLWLLGFLEARAVRISKSPILDRTLSKLADLSFGIFFLHIYLNWFVFPYILPIFGNPELGWIAVAVTTPFYILGIAVITEVARRTCGTYSRYLLGC